MKKLIIVCIAAAAFLAGCSQETRSTENAESLKGGQSPASPSAEVTALNEANFDSHVAQGVVLVHFSATWAWPCRKQGPIVEQVAERIGGDAKIAKLDIDTAPKIVQRLKITSIPTLIVFKDGKPVRHFVGVTQAETLVSAIQAALKPQA